jgi:glycosyltransferase involved in cell wall biosynthesis
MRIAVYENLPPGGALRASYELGRELVARGHHLDLYRLSTFPDKGPFDLARDAASVHVTPYRPLWGALDARLRDRHHAPRSYTLFGPLRRVQRSLAARIRSGGYDVVLLHNDALTQGPYVLRWLDGVPTVYYCQEPPRFASERAIWDEHQLNLSSSPPVVGQLRVLEDRLVLGRLARADYETTQHAQVIVVNSVYSRERAWAAYTRNAVVCYLGIDAARFKPGNPAERRREILSVGAPVSAKGHELVVEALGLIPGESRPALRIILPRSGGTSRVEELARARNVELVIDTGLDEPAVVDRYQRALMTVCAARLEPFGLTPIESMGCGTPVVAINEAGYRESVVDGVTGILVEPDMASLAAGIARLADDAALSAKLGAAGRADVLERWTWKRTGDQMEDILEHARRPS